MNHSVKTAFRWLLVVIALCASSFAVFILGLGLMLWPDRSIVAALSAFGIAPRAAIEAAHHLHFFITILIWIVPPTCAIGYAARTDQRRALRLAISLSTLLFAVLCFFIGSHDSRIDVQYIAIGAALVVLAAVGFSFSKLKFPRMVTTANLVALLLLFSPSAIALVLDKNTPPEPKQLWSITLQPEGWFEQSMNTGSEYGATRQVVLTGDRVIAVFDTGQAPYQGKQPMSNYRIVSLDAKTGAKKNEINFVGRWGGPPYVYATRTGQIDVQSDPRRVLSPDLEAAANSNSAIPEARQILTAKQVPGSNFDPDRWVLADDQILQISATSFQLSETNGKPASRGRLTEPGSYAGASADGRRFAIQSSYSEGDPDFLVYEFFTIYDAQNGKAIATIHIKDLPERQSWSAFSPDGRYFVAGNPNKLTMYLLP